MATQRSIIWVDAAGLTRQTLPRGSATLAGLMTALTSGSNADVLQYFEGVVAVNGAPAPTAAAYELTADTADMLFQTATGTIVKLVLPAPQASLFLADGRTIDPANTTVTAIVTAAIAVLVDTAGAAVTTFLGGTRS